MAATKTKAKKEAPKEKKPLPALTAEQKAQVQRVEQAVQGLVSSIEATSLPGRHLWSLKKAINMSVMEVLRRRRGDPRVRRRASGSD